MFVGNFQVMFSAEAAHNTAHSHVGKDETVSVDRALLIVGWPTLQYPPSLAEAGQAAEKVGASQTAKFNS